MNNSKESTKSGHHNLKERLEDFYDTVIDAINVDNSEEIITGSPVGAEMW